MPTTTRHIQIIENESGVRVEYEKENGAGPHKVEHFPGVTLDQVSAVIVIGKKNTQNVIGMHWKSKQQRVS
jgi:hypothetical protein